MQYAVIADIHANLMALQAVLDDIGSQGGVDKIWCLGDIVGYGPEPHECIGLIKSLDCLCVAGNHDRVATEKIGLDSFNQDAVESVLWTKEQLKGSDILFLNGLPESISDGKCTLVHGTPRNPILEYMSSISNARENFACFDSAYCLCGHTHVPQVYQLGEAGDCITASFSENVKLVLGESRLIINPGSVGQPRDGDPRASYALYNDETGMMQLRRVLYDVRQTQDAMIKNGLPVRLAGRLETGR